jgi:NADH-quinone oxidoreductase subunit M
MTYTILGVPILTFLTFFPTVGALIILLLPSSKPRTVRVAAFLVSVITFAASIPLFTLFDSAAHGMQFVERAEWVKGLGISYHLGVDGISMLLILLTTLLTAVSILSSFSAITTRVKAYMVTFLLLETGMIGVFVSLDLFLFYIFWEVMLIPMYLLIGVWGGPRRVYAAVKFILYTVAGSLLMLVGILYLYFAHHTATGIYTFDLLALYDTPLGQQAQLWIFGAFALAFAIKVPMFPFHTWLPDAHVEAPTAGSVILAGVLLKMGVYGFLRFAMPLFPDAALAYTPWIVGLAVIGIVYGALVAMVQPDMKKLVAYSSVSHLGFVVLGLCALNVNGIQGAVFQMLNHGVSTGGLFMVVGMLSDRRHTRLISEFGGLKAVMPRLVAAFLLITLASIALPGMNGFVGEFLILLGAFRAHPRLTAVAATGVILSAVYMLWMFQRVNYGTVTNEKNRSLPDLTGREWAMMVPTIALCIFMGVAPNYFLKPMEASVVHVIDRINGTTTIAKSAPEVRRPGSDAAPVRADAPGDSETRDLERAPAGGGGR